MADDDRELVRQQAIRELISVAAFLVTLIAYQATIDPTFRAVWKARLQRLLGRGDRRDPGAEALEQVRREISWMEHGQPDGG